MAAHGSILRRCVLLKPSCSHRQPNHNHKYQWQMVNKPLTSAFLQTEEGIERKRSTGMEQTVMLSARELSIAWGDNPEYWTWVSLRDSRFKKVAKLDHVWWLDISGRLLSTKLSPNTTYVAYLIFKLENSYGFDYSDQNASVIIGDRHSTKTVCLERVETTTSSAGNPNARWVEVDIGEFFNWGRNNEEVVVRLFETKRLNWKSGLIVVGIEFRPKN